MPHIICTGVTDIRPVHAQFVPDRYDSNGWLIKTMKCYLDQTGRNLLIEAVAVRSGFSQNFYILVEHKENSLTIRIDLHTNVEKNEGVKRTLLVIRDLVASHNPALAVDKTNLPPEMMGETPGNP
ncbi:MAG: hypothetical protein K1X53_10290 [Candidatus Sumerlaeaceae bacterium]|nr:hypothetical protein [Candidatus Sumerlaeaceae bacterium]